MIIGFGSTETEVESNIEKMFFDKVGELYQDCEHGYFSEEVIGIIKKWADKIACESQSIADSFKEAAEYPSRYSRFWCYVLGDCNHICLIVSFHHINRRHAFSPDGWAMMQSKRIFEIDTWEAGRSNNVS